MMLAKIINAILIIIWIAPYSAAQVNLIPNPGFEDQHSIGVCWPDTTQLGMWPNSWIYPTSATVAYCYVGNCYPQSGVPQNLYGNQIPKEGLAYMFFSVASDTTWDFWRAYIQAKLIQPLEVGHNYCFSVYVSQSDSSARATDDFGAYFSDTAVHLVGYENLPFNPQVQNEQERYLDSKEDWMLVSGSFIASGGEEYVTIGNFLDSTNTTWIFTPPYGQQNFGWLWTAAYYVDMVSLYDCTGFSYNADAGEDVILCQGESTTLGSDDDLNRRYLWTPSDGLDDPNKARPVATPLQTTTYILSVVDEYVQQTYDTVTIYVDSTCGGFPVFISNVFSPNGDGVNDIVYVRSNSISEMIFCIYNRWGNLLFQTSDINAGWDGRNDEKECPAGVYFYSVEIVFKNGESSVRKGSITLLR